MAKRTPARQLIEGLEEIRAWKRGDVKLRTKTVRGHANRKRTRVQLGSGNVFADLGFPDAKELKLKVRLAVEVNRAVKERQLSQDKATKLLGIRQPHISELMRYRLDRFSVERLMDFLTRLGKDVEIRIAPRRAGRSRSAVQVHHIV